MSDQYILAIDQGTHSTRAIVFDGRGKQLASARCPVTLTARSHTEIEQSAEEIARSLDRVIAEVLADSSVQTDQLQVAGLATQRSSVLAWERSSGTPLTPVLSWQDRRTQNEIRQLTDHEPLIEALTGLRLSPHYGAGKMQWLLQHVEAVRQAHAAHNLATGPLASYLVQHLLSDTNARVDHANASRTLLWNVQTRDWDMRLLPLFGIPRDVLPDCRPIAHDYGLVTAAGVPLRAVNGDQTAALYAQGRPPEDTLLINIGTGAFVLMPVGNPEGRPDGLLAGISYSDADRADYYLEGTVNGAAAAVNQVARTFAVTDVKSVLPGWLAGGTEPTLFINTVGGLGAPWWRTGPEPYFLESGVDAAGALVAVIESIVFLLQANIALMYRHNPALRQIRASGGLANLDGLCQRLADLSGLPVHRPVQIEATARGIAWQAAGGPDDWPPAGPGERFTPQTNKPLQQRYERFIDILGSL